MMLIDANRTVNIYLQQIASDVISLMNMAKPQKPGKPEAERRTNPYTVRYNDEENALVEEIASHKALEVASWIRMVSVAAARVEKKAAADCKGEKKTGAR